MDALFTFAAIAGVILIGSMSPGPSFVVIARRSVTTSRADGIAAAFGMGLGSTLFAGAALFGLHIVLTNVPLLYLGLKVVGGSYLIYLAVRMWAGARQPLDMNTPSGGRGQGIVNSFFLGLVTQICNPKTAIAYASVFSVLLPSTVPLWFTLVIVPMVFVMETGWYTVVAVVFSSDGPRRGYLKAKTWIDRLAGAVMGTLGAKIIADA
jgi:threonine/homoserine/homoserine lactone efflux protein